MTLHHHFYHGDHHIYHHILPWWPLSPYLTIVLMVTLHHHITLVTTITTLPQWPLPSHRTMVLMVTLTSWHLTTRSPRWPLSPYRTMVLMVTLHNHIYHGDHYHLHHHIIITTISYHGDHYHHILPWCWWWHFSCWVPTARLQPTAGPGPALQSPVWTRLRAGDRGRQDSTRDPGTVVENLPNNDMFIIICTTLFSFLACKLPIIIISFW